MNTKLTNLLQKSKGIIIKKAPLGIKGKKTFNKKLNFLIGHSYHA